MYHKKILKIIQTIIGSKEDIKYDDDLSKYIASSLSLIAILGEVENTFDVEISEDYLLEINKYKSINDINDMIVELKNQ